jgi:hypothetical protein
MKQRQYHSISCAAAYSFSLYASTNKKSDWKQNKKKSDGQRNKKSDCMHLNRNF